MTKRFILFFLVTILVAGCVKTATKSYDYKLEVTETRTWSAAGISRIAATTVNGAVSVSATQDTIITAEITRVCYGLDSVDAENHIDNVVVTDNISGGQLTLEAEMPGDQERSYSASFEISTPESCYLFLATINGAVSVTSMIAGADVTTTNGALSLSNTRGMMELETTNGAVTVQNHSGSVDIDVENGPVNCDLILLDTGESVDLQMLNGNVMLSLPSDVSATFDASTTNGEVTVTGFASVNYSINEPTHKAGTIGSGNATITIITTNGDITIRAR